MFPLFLIMDRTHKLRIDHLHPNKFEFNIQFQNGVTDRFIYEFPSSEGHKQKLQKDNLSRALAIKQFEKHMDFVSRRVNSMAM